MEFIETKRIKKIWKTYSTMHINSTGLTLKNLTAQLQIFKDNERKFPNIHECRLVLMHFTEAILHYSLATTSDSDCLTQISIEELRRCRKMAAEIKSKINFLHRFDNDFADRCFGALEAVKNLEVPVSIINVLSCFIYAPPLLQPCLSFCTRRENTALGCLKLVRKRVRFHLSN